MTKSKFLLLAFLILFGCIIVKLFLIQIANSNALTVDYLRTNKIYPERGKIFDRNYQPIAVNQTTYALYAEPKKISDKDYVAVKLSETLSVEKASIEARIDEKKDWVAIQAGVTKGQKDALLKMKLTGIGFNDEFRRYYPESSLSAHILGFVGKKADGTDTGYFGIEGFYDKDLAGLTGLLKSERDLEGRPIFFGTQERIESENGRDLILTVDRSVQQIIKTKLLSALERYKAKQGCVIVANPDTLEILGLVCLPDFDPDLYYKFSEDYFKNPTISEVYEPGSIFKPLIVAAAIEEKAIKPDDEFQEEGPVTIGDYTIKTWNNKYEGKISITRILEKSSNVGIVYIGDKLGEKKTYSYIQKYGFGELTNIDLQGEFVGYMRPVSLWYPIDYATVTFGQGIAVTPIQMIRAFASIINGGKLMKPYMVKQMISERTDTNISPHLDRITCSQKTSDIIKKMLVSTVENGEVSWAKPKGYMIGGKTGTAQIPIKGHYDPSKTIASFIGFAPVDKPRFIALVMLKEPQASQWGSETAAPLFFEIAKELIVYYNIAPDQ